MKNKDLFEELRNIDRLIHEPARVAILSLLLVVEEADFVFVMNKTGLSQGNLSSHLAKLEENNLVEIEKMFKGKRPHTILKISREGEDRLRKYIKGMKKFLDNF